MTSLVFSFNRFFLFLLIFIPLFVYVPSLFFGYTNLDDTKLISEQISTLQDPSHLPSYFHSTYLDYYYRPIITISFALNAIFFGNDLFFYHFTNIGFHILNILLVYVFLRLLTFSWRASFFGALIFSVYPTVVPAVSWVPGRNDILLLTFFLASFILLLMFFSTKQWVWAFFSIFFFFISLLTKETALVFVLFYFISFLGLRKKRLVYLIPFIGYVLCLFLYLTFVSNVLDQERLSFFQYASHFLENIQYYIPLLGETLFPLHLSFLKHVQDGNFILGVLALLILMIFFIIFRVRKSNVFFLGLSVFILSFVPALGYLNHDFGADLYFVANRYYLPFLGIVVMVWSTSFWQRVPLFIKKRQWFFSILFIVFLCITSFTMSMRYRDVFSFWENETLASPNSFRTHFRYANILYEHKRYKEALNYFKKAEAISPKDTALPYSIGSTYLHLSNTQQALSYFEKDLLYHPKDAQLRFEVGLLYYSLGLMDLARYQWEQSLLYNSNLALVNYNLGILSLKTGDPIGARTYFLRELGINPKNKRAQEALDTL